MNRRHLLIASASLFSFGGAAALLACGSDDSDSGGGGAVVDFDSGADATQTAPLDAAPPITVTVEDGGGPSDASILATDAGSGLTVYAGQSARIDATGMMDASAVSFVWTLDSAPTGSAVTTASIVNATSATPSIPTDKVGSYVVSVTATAGSLTVSAKFTVVAAAAHVIYGFDDTTQNVFGMSTVDTDGTNGHAVICPFSSVLVASFNAETAAKGALENVDTLEGAPGSATQIAFAGPQQYDAGNGYSNLFVTSSNGTCPTGGDAGSSAVAIATGGAMGNPGIVNLAHPRISPDGTKVVYTTSYSTNGFPATIQAVNVDGGSLASLGTLDMPDAATSFDTSGGMDRQPEWVGGSAKVTWTRPVSGSPSDGWQVVTSAVPAGASDPQVYMTCTLTPPALSNVSYAPVRAIVLPTGGVLTLADVTDATDLVVLTPDATTKACSVTHNLSNLSNSDASNVEAFALSPDGNTVAFVANDPGQDGTGATTYILYTVPVDGSRAPTRVGAANLIDVAGGVRWIAGGSQLAFTHATDAGINTVATVPVTDAGQANDVVIGDGGITVTAVGEGDRAGCSFGGKSAPIVGVFGGVLAMLGIARSRRRRARSSVTS